MITADWAVKSGARTDCASSGASTARINQAVNAAKKL